MNDKKNKDYNVNSILSKIKQGHKSRKSKMEGRASSGDSFNNYANRLHEINIQIKNLKSEKEKVAEIVKECMENAVKLEVPLDIEMEFADNWLDAH